MEKEFATPKEFVDYWFNQCIPMVHEDLPMNIIYYYDPILLRISKLNYLNGVEEVLKPTEESEWLFYQDQKNGWFDVKYNKIWSVLESKYNMDHQQIKDFFVAWLKEHDKIGSLTPIAPFTNTEQELKEHDKISSLTTF